MKERHGERSKDLKVFNIEMFLICSGATAARASGKGKGLGEVACSMNHHGNKKERLESIAFGSGSLFMRK